MSKANQENKKYNILKDKKMLGSIILIVTVIIQIFSWLNVPVLSSMHGYTIGMLFGLYNPLFYVFIIYISLKMIFSDKLQKPAWMKLTNKSYWFVAISIIFVGTSFGFYQSKTGFTNFGSKAWGSFNDWFEEFTSSSSAWAPKNTNGGIVGAFFYSFVSMCLSGIGSIIVAITVLIMSVSLLITGTTLGLYKETIKKRSIDLKRKEIKADKEADITNFQVPEEEKKETKVLFDDPFLD